MLKTVAIGGEVLLIGREGVWQHSDEGGQRDCCYSLQHVPSLIQEMWRYSTKTMAPCMTRVQG